MIDRIYLMLLKEVLTLGCYVETRGKATLELLGMSQQIPMNQPVILLRGRKLSYRFMCDEAQWILSGSDRLEHMDAGAKLWSQFSDDGIRLNGAYGPPISAQILYVVETLKRDKHSRQAVITTWRPNPPESKDIPCTISLQFLIRKDQLHIVSNMRSNDMWHGFPYDVFVFSMVANYVRILLQSCYALGLGMLYHNVGSLHLYEAHIERASQLLQDNRDCPEIYGAFETSSIYTKNTIDSLMMSLRNGAKAPIDQPLLSL